MSSTSSEQHQHHDKNDVDNSSSLKEKIQEKVHNITILGEKMVASHSGKKEGDKEEPSNKTISSLPEHSEAAHSTTKHLTTGGHIGTKIMHSTGAGHHPTTGGHGTATHVTAKHPTSGGHHPTTHPTGDGHHETTKTHNP